MFLKPHWTTLVALLLLPLGVTAQERQMSAEAVVFDRYERGVFTIYSDEGQGSGFLVDSRGLVLTNAHVVGDSRRIRVLVDDETKIEATVIVLNKEEDLAVLRIHERYCQGLPVLPLPDDLSDYVRVGERVLTIGSPLMEKRILTTGIVSGVAENKLISDVNINPGNSGGPLLNLAGTVVGITTFTKSADEGSGLAGIIAAKLLGNDLEEARSELSSENEPSDRTFPIAPDESFPAFALRRAALAPAWDFSPYRLKESGIAGKPAPFGTRPRESTPGIVGSFRVTIFTPPFLYRLDKEAEIASARRRQDRVGDQTGETTRYDPFDDLTIGSVFRDEWRPVVTLLVEPTIKTDRSIWTGSEKYKFKGDVEDFELLKNGQVVEEFRRSLFWRHMNFHVVTGTFSSASASDMARVGVAAYDVNLFLPEDGVWPELRVRLTAAERPDEPYEISIPRSTMERIALDFEPYFWVRKARSMVRRAIPEGE